MASFSDDFNRPDSSDLGAGWVEVSGDWSIVSNRLAPDTSSGTTILRAATTMASSDHFAQFTIAATAAASQGVWCRGNTNITSGYLWRTNGSSWDLFAVVGGSFNLIGTYAVAVAPGDVGKVQAVGSTIKAFVNGVERVSVVNADVPTGVNVGLRVMAVPNLRFDDFTAADVTAGAAIGTAGTAETALSLNGIKAASLGPADATGTAQPITGTKSKDLGAAAAAETAQVLAGEKASPIGAATVIEAAQSLSGGKTVALGAALETAAVLPFSTFKTAALDPAHAAEQAQSLGGAKRAVLAAAASREQAQPLTSSGPVTPSGPDIDITVGLPRSVWSAGIVHGSGWEVGEPW